MNCLFISCHASLEYYMCQIFKKLNVSIPFHAFDLDNSVRPLISGYRSNKEINEYTKYKNDYRMWASDDLRDINFIYLMNFPNLGEVVEYYSQFGIPIIIHEFGQYNPHLLLKVITLLIENNHIWLVVYSKTELDTYFRLTAHYPEVRCRIKYIPMSVDANEFSGWKGENGKVLLACDRISTRKDSCFQRVYFEAVNGLPFVLIGKETEKFGGEGRVDYNRLLELYRECSAFFSTGVIPAPYVLTPIEAGITGCPVVMYNNKYGIVSEELGNVSHIVNSGAEANKVLSEILLSNKTSVRESFVRIFSHNATESQWEDLLNEIS